MDAPRGNHGEGLAGSIFSEWQRRRIRHRMMRYRVFTGTSSWHSLGLELVHDTAIESVMKVRSADPKRAVGEMLRRFVEGETVTENERIAVLAGFLIDKGYLSPAELDEEPASLAPAFALAQYFGSEALPYILPGNTGVRAFEAVLLRAGRYIVHRLELIGIADAEPSAHEGRAPIVRARQRVITYRAVGTRPFEQWDERERKHQTLSERQFTGWLAYPDQERLLLFLYETAAQEHLILFAVGTEHVPVDAKAGDTSLHFLHYEPVLDLEESYHAGLDELAGALSRQLLVYYSVDQRIDPPRVSTASHERVAP